MTFARVGWFAALLCVGACNDVSPEVEEPTSGSDATASSNGSTGNGPGPSSATEVATMEVTSNGPSGTSADTTADASATDPTSDPTTGSGTTDPGTTDEGTDSTGEPGACHPMLVEVLYDPTSGNNNEQWIKLFNPCDTNIDLSTYSVGWGETSYTAGGVDLTGEIATGDCFIVGGPQTESDNHDPELDQATDLDPDLQVGGSPGNGVALFDIPMASVLSNTVPVDSVIYGDDNDGDLLDSAGAMPPPHVVDAPEPQSIRRSNPTTWIVEPNPMPNVCPPFV